MQMSRPVVAGKHPYVFFAVALNLLACSDQPKAIESVGVVRVPLVGSGSSGAAYRLENATFSVTGPTSLELDGNGETLQRELPVGDYSIELRAGWSLRRTSAGTVDATLVTDAMQRFQVREQQTTIVSYRFKVDGDVVVMTHGTLEVRIEIDEEDDAGAGSKDAAVSDGATDASTAPTCSLAARYADLGTIELTGHVVEVTNSNGDPVTGFIFDAPLGPGSFEQLRVELWRDFGVFSGQILAGTYQLQGDDTLYNKCGLCVLVGAAAELPVGAFATGGYIATAGTVTLSEVQDYKFTGTLENLRLVHIELVPGTQESVPSADGCSSELEGAEIIGQLTTAAALRQTPSR